MNLNFAALDKEISLKAKRHLLFKSSKFFPFTFCSVPQLSGGGGGVGREGGGAKLKMKGLLPLKVYLITLKEHLAGKSEIQLLKKILLTAFLYPK